jgi:putative ABC transport system permease protein
VISGNGQSPVASEIVDKARAVPGVDVVTTQRYALAHVNGAQLALSGVDVATIDRAVRRSARPAGRSTTQPVRA